MRPELLPYAKSENMDQFHSHSQTEPCTYTKLKYQIISISYCKVPICIDNTVVMMMTSRGLSVALGFNSLHTP